MRTIFVPTLFYRNGSVDEEHTLSFAQLNGRALPIFVLDTKILEKAKQCFEQRD